MNIKRIFKELIIYDVEKVIQLLKSSIDNYSEEYDEIILYASKYERIKKEIRLNLIDYKSSSHEESKLRYSILQFINNISENKINKDIAVEGFRNHKEIKDFLIFENKTEDKINKNIPVERFKSQKETKNDLMVENKAENLNELRISMIPYFFNGQRVSEKHVSPFIAAINLAEEHFGLNSTQFQPFKNGMALEARHFNAFMKPIESLRNKIGLKTTWKYYPLLDGTVVDKDIMNEVPQKVNEIVSYILVKDSI